ncbi:MAG: S26 family signal peptidase [Bacteroidia bacterium]|nr:S26 family signal peptidase [Bacteroidia bacterium]
MTVLQKNILKTVSISLPLIGLALWAKAYFLVPIILLVIFLIIHRREINAIQRAIDLLPQRVKYLVSVAICVALGIGIGAYIIAFVTDIDIYTSISTGKSRICFIDKLKYGSVIDKETRSCALGDIQRGNNAIIAIGDTTKTVLRIAAIPGDEISIVDGCAIVNGTSDYEVASAYAPFHVFHNTPLRIVHLIGRYTNELVDSAFRTSASVNPQCTLPVKEIYDNYRQYTYSVLHKNSTDERIFPYTANNNGLQMHPIHLPSQGETITFSKKNRHYLVPLINKYEDKNISIDKNGNVLSTNNTILHQYTFKYNYYFVLNDNRTILADSRLWGPIPEYQIIGSTSNISQ